MANLNQSPNIGKPAGKIISLMVSTINDATTNAVSMRELYDFLEVKARFNDWSKRMFEYGFTEGEDFVAVTQKRVTAQGNETTFTDYALTLDTAKEISMIQRTAKGKQARQYFIEIEKRYTRLVTVKVPTPKLGKRINKPRLPYPDFAAFEGLTFPIATPDLTALLQVDRRRINNKKNKHNDLFVEHRHYERGKRGNHRRTNYWTREGVLLICSLQPRHAISQGLRDYILNENIH